MPKKKIDYTAMFTLRKDGRYQGSYRDENNKQRFVCDRDPERLFFKIKELEDAIKAGLTQKHVPTFREIAEKWEAVHREEIEVRTWKNYAPHYNDIVAEHGNTPFPEIEAVDVSVDLARAKAKGLSATVVKTRRSLWSMIFDFAVLKGVVKYNPVQSIKLPKGLKKGKRKGPTDEQMNVILRSADEPFGLFALMLLCTGLRKSECLALKWSDIDFKNKVISIEKSIDYTVGAKPKYKDPKSEAGVRHVPILNILIPPLKDAMQKTSSIFLFPCPKTNRGGPGGGLMTDKAYETAWHKYCVAVGFINAEGKHTLTAHNLRHGMATLMFEFGADELTTQNVMGHSNIQVTREIYTDLRNKQQQKSVGKVNRGMAKKMAKAVGS